MRSGVLDMIAHPANSAVAMWTRFFRCRFVVAIAGRGFGLWCGGLGCRLTSWICLRSALGISMIAINLPTTWVV